MGFEQEQQEAAERAKEADFRANYRGKGDPGDAYKVQQAIDASDAREKRTPPKVDKTALARVSDILNHVVNSAARFRNDDLTDEDKAELVRTTMEDANDVPPSSRAALKAEVEKIIEAVATSGDTNAARHASRAAAFRISQTLPKTFAPKDERLSEDDRDAILARIPRS